MLVSRRYWSWSWSPRPKIHFLIALGITLVAITLFFVSFSYSYRQVTQNPIVEGIVVKSVSGADGVHTPIIEYNSLTEGVKRFKSKLSSKPQSYFVGDSVQVILIGPEYSPKLKSFFGVYGLSAFFFLFSSICVIGTTAIYFFRVRPSNA